jgi:hypothetical protein
MKLKLSRSLARRVHRWLQGHGCYCPNCQSSAALLEPFEIKRALTFVRNQVSAMIVKEQHLMHEVRSRCLRCGFDQNVLPLEVAGIVVEDDRLPS